MAKISLPTISSGFLTTTQLNNAFDQIEAEFQNKVLYRDNPVGEPNQILTDIDLNNNDILNVNSVNVQALTIAGDTLTEAISAASSSVLAGATASATSAATSASQAATSASQAATSASQAAASATASATSATNSETSAVGSAASAAQASNYSSLGLGGAAAFDFGMVTDSLIIFPTNWGTIV